MIGGREVADRTQAECLLSFDVATSAAADQVVGRARAAGAEVVTEPGPQPWGYAGVFADPDGHLWMVTAGAALT
ncbi:VOC family protein [Salinispora arenicola]|uniref:VOC family protein n=1 Tax=Salinispora arenicola TaxID=168697 RepID=UPI0003AA6178|nr:VOC family protein [Salinispora arenicola]